MESPYRADSVLKLRLGNAGDVIEVKVMRTFEPFTLASVMVVELLSHPPADLDLKQGATAVLKVYDRRFNETGREWYYLPPWSDELESDYVSDLIQNPPYHGWHPLEDPDCEGLDNNEGINEDSVTEAAEVNAAIGCDDSEKLDTVAETPTETIVPRDSQDKDTRCEEKPTGDDDHATKERRDKEIVEKERSDEKVSTQDKSNLTGQAVDENIKQEKENRSDSAEEDEDFQNDGSWWGTKPVRIRKIQWNSLNQAENEEKLYNALNQLQKCGKVPQYFASVDLIPDTKVVLDSETLNRSLSDALTNEDRKQIKEYLRYPGCLISYVEGFRLEDIKEHAPQEDWKKAIKAATNVINHLNDYPVLHEDVRPENIIMQKTTDTDGKNEYAAVVIDFANGRLRGEEETDEEWKEVKFCEGEESAIGAVMYNRLDLGKFEKTIRGDLRWD